MPTLANMFSRINRLTAQELDADDIYAALNEAGFYVYTKVLKENRGFFIKFDTTSIALVPGTQVYALPSDATDILHLAERAQPTQNWFPIDPTSLASSLQNQANVYDYFIDDDWYDGESHFKYYGPYLDSADTVDAPDVDNTDQVQKIQITPAIDINRAVEIVYAAKWLPILDGSSELMLPEEGTHAMYNGAMATLTGDIDDTREGSYGQRAKLHLDAFLTWVRDRQMQSGPKVKPYL